MTYSTLDTSLSKVLGGRTATAFEKAFGYTSVGDLLGHYPRRYASKGELTNLAHLPRGETVTIVAEVRDVRERPMRNKRGGILEVKITDGTGILTLTFFNQSWRSQELRVGARGIFSGKVGEYRGVSQLAHPLYELFDEGVGNETAAKESSDEGSSLRIERFKDAPIPIYPATGTIASWQIERSIEVIFDSLPQDLSLIPDPVPESVRRAEKLVGYGQALKQIHRPENDGEWQPAAHALRFQEAFLLQLALLERRALLAEQPAEPRPIRVGGVLEGFDRDLSFTLTSDQRVVGERISAELAGTRPMNRLVQGEVGSGKTLVALRAMLQVADSGGQAALLAPTEVLAAQHFRSIVHTLGPDLAAKLIPVLVTGQLSAAERKRAMLQVASGNSRLIVGTHALMAESVQFFDLGLVVVDEQHRFGVEQREALRAKARTSPHTVVLTATPIPRTVAMTVFGDLDISTIRELPAGRAGITSHVVPLVEHPGWINRTWQRVAEELKQGRQAFVVCPAIAPAKGSSSGSETLEPDSEILLDDDEQPEKKTRLATVEETLVMLRQHPQLSGARVEGLHGAMSSEEKDAVMQAFAEGEIGVLVATTVIEVGVNVPNASTMVVLNADRFGVSQLHQLRGRVGRGQVPGLALFVTEAMEGTLARERVEAVASTLDGFKLAQVDLELRKEGDVLGTNQAGGKSSLRLLRVVRDGALIERARELAETVLAEDQGLHKNQLLRRALDRRLDETAREFLGKS
ncbi:ATP-dependent DNA helicase RecG [Lysinibacter sp. HNR]|uniref:ATP-dependent DNA helicase RecG n=1 Tax=Lysinibacter sp. HNR TaxID=3031408 RepID=UPI002434B97F|nr:ATP-dependent DNA helicase RecG [Lysinibacter sp. HNR]WGD38399.1 ATP-dependent DNA helicase RecG [Lysinibacter sp. HNR]